MSSMVTALGPMVLSTSFLLSQLRPPLPGPQEWELSLESWVIRSYHSHLSCLWQEILPGFYFDSLWTPSLEQQSLLLSFPAHTRAESLVRKDSAVRKDRKNCKRSAKGPLTRALSSCIW